MSTRLPVVLLGLAVFCAGCNDAAQQAALSRQVDVLKEQFRTLDAQVKTLQRESDVEKFLRNASGVAYLTPGTDGYSTLETDIGTMTVSLANVEPYANGSRITLQFGNPSTATANSVKATVEWGRVDSNGSPDNDSARSREITFAQALRAASWTSVPLVLEAVPPADLGFVRLRDVTVTGITLLKGPR